MLPAWEVFVYICLFPSQPVYISFRTIEHRKLLATHAHFLDSLCGSSLKHILRPELISLSGLANLHIKNLKVPYPQNAIRERITLFAAVYRIYICFPLKCDEINQLGFLK